MTPHETPSWLSLAELRRKARWLSSHARNVTSQCGEDGIIDAALKLLPRRDRWCVELGAADEISLSNTWDLIRNHGYSAILIEGDRRKYRKLVDNYRDLERVVPLNVYVGLSTVGRATLDVLLSHTPIPADFDFLSLDVDGNDYHIWASLERYRPKLVLIEFNPTMTNSVFFVQPAASRCNQGSSPRALVELGKRKGYELVAATEVNVLFVDGKYFGAFDIPDNSLELIRDDSRCPWIALLYDGTVLLGEGEATGGVTLRWHGLRPPQCRVQLLPSILRRYPGSFGFWRSGLYAAWLALHAPGRLRKILLRRARKVFGDGVGAVSRKWS